MSPDPGLIFGALADPNRRAMLDALDERSTTSVPELTSELPITRQAVAKHLATLGDAGLVRGHLASGLVVPGSGRVVAVVGLDDVVVVDTPDALLVTTRDHAQRVKGVVAGLRSDRRDDLL